MNNKHSRASHGAAPPGADDFKLIRGIGQNVESRLHNAGIHSFAQFAALSPDEVAELLADLVGMSSERIAKQDWIGQAQALALKREQVLAETQNDDATLIGRQHYATFTVELLLDEDNNVRRTRVVHIQTKEEDKWASWEEARLLDFLIRRAALRLPSTAAAPPTEAPMEHAPSITTPIEPAVVITEEGERPPPLGTTVNLGGVLRLHDLQIVTADFDRPSDILRSGQPFQVHLTLNLTDVVAPRDVLLVYTVNVYAKRLGAKLRETVGEARGTITWSPQVILDLKGTTMPPGSYRLEAVVALSPSPVEPPSPLGLMALLGGGMLQVY